MKVWILFLMFNLTVNMQEIDDNPQGLVKFQPQEYVQQPSSGFNWADDDDPQILREYAEFQKDVANGRYDYMMKDKKKDLPQKKDSLSDTIQRFEKTKQKADEGRDDLTKMLSDQLFAGQPDKPDILGEDSGEILNQLDEFNKHGFIDEDENHDDNNQDNDYDDNDDDDDNEDNNIEQEDEENKINKKKKFKKQQKSKKTKKSKKYHKTKKIQQSQSSDENDSQIDEQKKLEEELQQNLGSLFGQMNQMLSHIPLPIFSPFPGMIRSQPRRIIIGTPMSRFRGGSMGLGGLMSGHSSGRLTTIHIDSNGHQTTTVQNFGDQNPGESIEHALEGIFGDNHHIEQVQKTDQEAQKELDNIIDDIFGVHKQKDQDDKLSDNFKLEEIKNDDNDNNYNSDEKDKITDQQTNQLKSEQIIDIDETIKDIEDVTQQKSQTPNPSQTENNQQKISLQTTTNYSFGYFIMIGSIVLVLILSIGYAIYQKNVGNFARKIQEKSSLRSLLGGSQDKFD